MNVRLPRIFHQTLPNIHHAAFWLACFSGLSALLGLLRDRMLASIFGASRELDLYYAAFRVPDIIYTGLLFFVASTAIIPIVIELHAKNKESREDFLGSLLFFFSLTVFWVSFAVFFLMPFLIAFLFPGFSAYDRENVVAMSRIMLLSPIFLGFSNIFSGIAQAFQRFFIYAISPVLYNIGIIIGIVFFLPQWGLAGLAWGAVLGAFFHVGLQMVSFFQIGTSPRFRKIANRYTFKTLMLSFPRTLGLAANQIVTTIFIAIASMLAPGSIAIFTLSSNLEYIPVTLIGLSYSVAAFPNLTQFSLQGAQAEFRRHFTLAFRHILFWSLPFAVLFLVLRAQIVRVILGSGAFTWTDTRLTAASLFLLSLAVIFQSLFLLLVRAFYAERHTMRPFFINMISAALSVGSVFWFLGMLEPGSLFFSVARAILRLTDIPDIRVLSLPFGVLTGSIVNFIFLFAAFKVAFGWVPTAGSTLAIGKIFCSSAVGGLVAYGGLQVFSFLFNLQTFFGIFLQGFCAGILGLGAILMILWVLESEELFEIYRGARSLVWEDHVPAPEPEKIS